MFRVFLAAFLLGSFNMLFMQKFWRVLLILLFLWLKFIFSKSEIIISCIFLRRILSWHLRSLKNKGMILKKKEGINFYYFESEFRRILDLSLVIKNIYFHRYRSLIIVNIVKLNLRKFLNFLTLNQFFILLNLEFK